MNTQWIKAIPMARLEQKEKTIFRFEGKQIALFLVDGEIYACNNRCPHEGYPLREGMVDKDCILTCNWHNWKFNLNDGANLYGGDRLRVYPVEVRGDDLWLDVSDPPAEQRRAEIMANLRDAFDDHAYERLARELGRLRLTGADPLEALVAAIEWTHERLEFGWTHAYAGAADWLTLYDEYDEDPETQLVCLLEAIGHMAWDTLREHNYPYTQGSRTWDEQTFVQAVDDEDEARAASMVRGALAAGLRFEDLEGGFTRAALRHYNDFGHALIYVTKARKLIARLGDAVALPLLLSLTREMIFATREDQIPEFRSYADALTGFGSRPNGHAPTMAAFQGLGIDKALKLTTDHGAAPAEELFEALLGANARNMLDFDMSYQDHTRRPVADNVGWLDFTHGITFANAVHTQCRKFPDTWPAGLLQLACFSGRNNSYTQRGRNDTQWHVDDTERFLREAIDALFDHGKEEYIVSVHLVKTLLAAREELHSGVNGEVGQTMIAAVNRFLNSPLKRKHARRTANQAMEFVARDG